MFSIVVAIGMLFSGLSLSAQGVQSGMEVTGVILDAATKTPINGARVAVAETALSVLTDENGNYKIKVPSTSEVLIITAPDHALREVPLQGRQTVDAELYSGVFTTGYETLELLPGQKKRRTITVNPVDIATDFDKSTAITIDTEIQSKLGADVRTITRSGVPGMGAAMFIRGLNSLNANAQPLFVIDGVIWNHQLNSTSIHQGYFANPFESIDVNDIEDVTVIKDGNSIYGSKAANGVILITTKRGRDMTTRITADLSIGLNQKPSFPKMMNADQYRIYASNQAQGWLQVNESNQFQSQLTNQLFPFLDPDIVNYRDYQNNTKWTDEVYRDGLYQNIGLSVSGGDEVALYNLSMGYVKTEGTVEDTDMERFNARFNADIRMFSKMYTNVDISIARITRNLSDDGVDSKTAPGFISLIKAPILASHRYVNNSDQFSPKLSFHDTLDPTSANAVSNPVSIVEEAMGTAARTTFNMRVNPYYQFTNNIRFGTIFGYTMSRMKESFFIPKAGIAPLIINGVAQPYNEVRDMTQRQNSVYSDTRLDWKLEFEGGHQLSLLGGFRFSSDSYNSMLPKGYNTGNDNVKVLISDLMNKSVTGTDDRWKSMSWYANAIYDYRNKYILSLTASADASSRFGKEAKDGVSMFGTRWGIFPSAAGAWVISSEEFMKNVTPVNLLKLRASYSITGNDDIDTYAARSYFKSATYYQNAIGLVLGNIQNETIQWETTKKWNVGIDTHLFNERLGITFDVYGSKTDNLLTLKPLKNITGFEFYWGNEGELKNNGYELGVNGKILNLRDFQWELGVTMGHYKNEIVSLPTGGYETEIPGNGTIRTEVGQPLGVFYGYKTNGVYKSTEEASRAHYDPQSETYRALVNANGVAYGGGDVRFIDKNNDGKINDSDKQIIGDPNPDFYGNIASKFKYKHFTLDVLFTYSYGNDVYNYLRSQLESGSTFYNQTTALVNRWTTPGQETSIPRAVYGDPMGNNVFSDRWIEDGSYLRLKTLTLSYDIPFRLSFLQGITVWASANNLWTWTKYLGSDPEFSMNNSVLLQGIDNGLTPQGRSYHVGVKINL
ncbi:MAG: SusC/RagA family TonB-linked outer membrane protein [Bacteroidales bacterium]|nr:SusC/RagA family TonB-linked outer membrane protein [Bacteroidales bacterium]